MNEHQDQSYVYTTPFLDEITRIRKVCGEHRFSEPAPYYRTKIDDFNNLLAQGEDIAVTHTTFLNATQDTTNCITDGGYTLIADEVLDVVVDFNKATENEPVQHICSGDIDLLVKEGLVSIDNNFKVSWTGGEYGDDNKFSMVAHFAKLGRLYCVRQKLMLCVFPPSIFAAFRQVYILTYLFEGSTFKSYLDLFGIDYEILSVQRRDDGRYYICEHDVDSEMAFRKKSGALVTVCNNDRINRGYKHGAFSKSWFETNACKKDVFERLRGDMRYFFETVAKAKAKDILFTCPNDYISKVKGKGYTCVRSLTREEKSLPDKERKKIERTLSCFVPLNARASNDYRERWALAYIYNMNQNPLIEGLFIDNGVTFNKDLFAVSCLIQWVFRSRIRENQSVILYLPSPRMRELFQRWLDGDL